ncbi:MAG: MbnP family protein [Lewinella sp.]|uniref:MbnP family protein n=1 Tax=Lewinella sp. TaxID=2004506 RepID=UPI003D6BD040
MNFNKLMLALLVLSVSLYSCDDDDVSRLDSDVAFEFDYSFAGSDFDYDQVYDLNGTAVSFQTVQFYVGGITLHPEEGDAVTADGKYLLVKPKSGAQEVMNVDKKHYHMAEFFVGVAPAENDQTADDFDTRDTETDPLARQSDPPMNWNWNAGYIFVRIDGMVDLDGDGTPETVMEYHLGKEAFRRTVAKDLHTDIEDDSQTLAFGLDVAALFNDIDISQTYSVHTGDDLATSAIFADNIADAITKK